MPTAHLAKLLAASLLATASAAQSNSLPGLDVALSEIRNVQALGRSGAFPNGVNGVSFLTTICNDGAIEVPWKAPMSTDHPMIAFLVARESNGRLEQISDRSYVKHGFFAANGSKCSDCNPPLGQLGERLGVGCSDTYSTSNNGDRFYLGPPIEIDPWLGEWEPECSHFDRGEPPVVGPAACDRVRSLTTNQANALGPVSHRIELSDADLNVPGAKYFAQAQYVVPQEPERRRDDSLGARGFAPSWNGAGWDFSEVGPLRIGSVLERWSGATVRSNTNGDDDGRVYVAVKVTGPVQGIYRYEYAVHNRDATRGVGAFHVPVCPQAHVRGVGFRDIDSDPGNDWSVSVTEDRISFTTTSNPIEWNTFYNFWFDSDADPTMGALALDAFAPGPGAASVAVSNITPSGVFTLYLGTGCADGGVPSLHAVGTPARALLGNAGFALASSGNVPGARSTLVLGTGASPVRLEGCTLWTGTPARVVSTVVAGADGIARHPLPIACDAALEGLELAVQAVSGPAGGAAHDRALSNALRIRVGNGIVDCP